MAQLKFIDVNKVYPNGYHAVHDFNMEISDGEFICLVGDSGCGKSTTLRMIAGLEDITAGEFYIDGKLANQTSSRDRGIAMVFQSYALYPHLTVYENLAFGLTLEGIDAEVIDEKVKATAKILGLTDYLERFPRALSGGQCQRVAVGRALIRKVNIFLMDEPLSNLDAKLRAQMRLEIIRLHQRLQATFVYVTHDQTEAMTMGDRIVVMKGRRKKGGGGLAACLAGRANDPSGAKEPDPLRGAAGYSRCASGGFVYLHRAKAGVLFWNRCCGGNDWRGNLPYYRNREKPLYHAGAFLRRAQGGPKALPWRQP